VRAKIGIVDDGGLRLGSAANLNEHSLFNDTEMNIVACDPQISRATRFRSPKPAESRPIALNRLVAWVRWTPDTVGKPGDSGICSTACKQEVTGSIPVGSAGAPLHFGSVLAHRAGSAE
jgi:phosphatidylserine/phosphatidylglycerophosphate/cardiolipin synthase-like enzyme